MPDIAIETRDGIIEVIVDAVDVQKLDWRVRDGEPKSTGQPAVERILFRFAFFFSPGGLTDSQRLTPCTAGAIDANSGSIRRMK